MKNFVVVIPARLKSSRLPNKPLLKIKGIPMIIRTFQRCNKVVKKENIFVATDSNKIINLCKKYNIKTVLTSMSGQICNAVDVLSQLSNEQMLVMLLCDRMLRWLSY